jgi:hypothetical protein
MASAPSVAAQQNAQRRVERNMNTTRRENVIAKPMTTSIVTPVNRNWKCIQCAALIAVLALSAGCGGLHASKSISPATFLLPGLMKNETPAPQNSIIPPVPPGELLTQN